MTSKDLPAVITRVTRPKDFPIAYVADAETLQRIADALMGVSPNVEYEVALADGTMIRAASAGDVIGVQNSRDRRITSISLATPWEPNLHATVRLRDYGSSPISFEVSGTSERDVLYLSEKLAQTILGMRQWYTRLALLDFVSILILFLAAVWVVLVVAIFVMQIRSGPTPPAQSQSPMRGLETPLLIIFLGLVLMVGAILNRLRAWLFPMATFLIGDGIKRHESLIFWRKTVAGGLAVSFVGSLIVALMTR